MFGSYAKEKNDKFSDIDIMVKFNENIENQKVYALALKKSLQKAINVPVDIVVLRKKPDDFDLGILKHAIEIKWFFNIRYLNELNSSCLYHIIY